MYLERDFMYFVSLRSGSYGNGYLISDGATTLMFDAGVPRKLVFWAMRESNIPAPKIIFISHEHSDHIKSLGILLRAFSPNIKVVATSGTLDAMTFLQNAETIVLDRNGEISVENFSVRFVQKPHDAADPVAFFVEHTSKKSAAIVTDIGHPNDDTISGIAGANLLLVESNYDPKMLENCDYPELLKARIDGPYGHLSNRQCSKLLSEYVHSGLQKVILGHISEDNNFPEIAKKCSRKALPATVELDVASRYEPSITIIE